MNVVERFLKYISYDTMSDPNSTSAPTTSKQLLLAKELVEEMKNLGIENALVDEFGIVYGWIEANIVDPIPAIGFIAHMDTSPDMSGLKVTPRIIRNYDGSTILLNDEQKITMSPNEFASLNNHIGKDLIVTDGTTLLGADDKAGIAEIMTMVEQLLQSERPHGKICIAFTPDEEVGHGTDHFNIAKFGACYAYTVDGGEVDCIDYENFNAASCHIKIQGSSIHPGSAKNKMVNASLIAMLFQSMLPVQETPEFTEGYEGFHHLTSVRGACEEAELEYIIRNHNEEIFARQKADFIRIANYINDRFGENTVTCSIQDSYANMRQIIEKDMTIVQRVKTAMQSIGIQPRSLPIRGGTDGARLTYDGLPCPNLGTGGYNYHGKYEYACIQEMEQSVALLLQIIKTTIQA